jgi:hypothetical protein
VAGGPSGAPPFSRARAFGGLFLYVLVGILSVIDALSPNYAFELGPMALMLGTGTVLLGVEGVRKVAERIVNGE